ncbi:hypothetical protein [Streptomyces sp. NBC_01264]|uniref:hypothetical protein n=1 Tax=Streptomyces sp. NBC_01264 TaxID=2903804 RepID=UPI0022539C1B|nr:hypothetical protein [Streptomyces sp. NBC_01264]MCX4778248.1 hypothetical protein [Streptomyces sp. NBC_01264]
MDVTSWWFEVEDPEECGEEPWDFGEAELAFLAALRGRAADWRVPWAPSQVGRPEDESSFLVHISLVDEARRIVLGEWAVHFHGTHVRAGRVRDQLFHLDESPERGFFRASGTVAELAERCADWFESLLSRPVVRVDWPSEGGRHATTWEFADTGEVLTTSGPVPAVGSAPVRRLAVRP